MPDSTWLAHWIYTSWHIPLVPSYVVVQAYPADAKIPYGDLGPHLCTIDLDTLQDSALAMLLANGLNHIPLNQG
jgi:hypothetical protein